MKFSVKFAVHVTALVLIVQFAEAQQPAPEYSSVVNANTRFALKIVRGRASGLKQNEVVSPIALSAGFALLRNGANSQCAAEIGGAFEFGQLPNDDSNREFGALMGELLSREPERPLQRSTGNLNQKSPAQTRATRQAVSSEPKPPNGLYLANSFWNLRTNFSDAFRSVNADFYHAKVAHLSRAEDAVAAINAWANAKSYGRITRVVDSAGSDAFLFASLLYFRAHWRTPFLPSSTHQSDFTLLSGAKKTEQMMKEFGHFSYQQTAEFEAIVLPYNDGRDLYVFLPAESSSLQQFEASLTDENWNKWRKAMSYREGTVEMPKFAVGAEVDVQKLLTDIGTDCAFAGFAAFSRAFPLEGGKLTHAEQLLSFSADELGSEAVVYTGVGGVPGGVAGGAMGLYQAPPPFHMVVNRPFLPPLSMNVPARWFLSPRLLNPEKVPPNG